MSTRRLTAIVLLTILLSPLVDLRQALAANPGDMVINEIHADPASGLAGDANGDGTRDSSDDEFVEIYNASGGDLDLNGWTLSDGFGLRHTFPGGSVVMAGCSVVVFGGPTPTGTFGGSLVQTASSTALGLNNSGDTVTLNDGTTDIAIQTYGSEGGDNQSLTRDPDITGAFVKHSVATGSGGSLWSPGTMIDGSAFGGCGPPPLAGIGSADPDLLTAGESTLLTVAVTPGTAPPSTGLAVGGDLTPIGGSATQSFFDDGTNGDVTAGDNVFSFATTVAASTTPGAKSLPISMSDDQGRTGSTSITLTVIETLTIMQIQGEGRSSPFAGDFVETSGLLTLITANGRDAWIQDPNGDGDPATSDGIFIDDFNTLSPEPLVGDLITVRGQVEEQQFGNALPLTRIDDTVLVEIVSGGNPLPAPVTLGDLPDEFIPDGELFWEPLEGMLVSVENAPVVAPTNQFGEFGMLTKDDAKPGSGFFPQQQHILLGELSQDPNVIDYNPERVFVDDASLVSPVVVRPGDRVRSLVGVVDYTFGMYKLQPASFDVFTHNLPELPASTRSGSNGDTVITTFNVENLFDLELNTPEVKDSLGRVGEDPGSGWGSPPTFTQNNTLTRKPEVCQGDTDPGDPFDPAAEWIGLGNDNFSDLGTHTVTCGNTSGLIISEYVEGSSFNKALEIYNGTGSMVNLGAANVTVQIFFNGNTSAGRTISLSGTLADGDVFVLAHPSADQAILNVTDQTSDGVLFNGDDAITLNIGGKDDAGSTPTPEALETQLAKLALAIEVELRLPEIIVVQEVENTGILEELGDLVDAATGTDYVATSFETSDGRGIEVGFLWDANRVALLDAFQMSGPGVEQWFGPNSPSPGREPLVGVFDIEGQMVTIIGNHFKSKGGDDPLYGVNWPPFRITEIQRKGQARVVRDFANGILDSYPGASVMVTGDLNDFQFGEPDENLIGSEPGHPVSILEGSGAEVPLINLLDLEKPAETFTFVFDGNSQVLDHMLVSPALLNHVVGADILHFNAGFPSDLGEDAGTTLRASDHDPVEGRFKFR